MIKTYNLGRVSSDIDLMVLQTSRCIEKIKDFELFTLFWSVFMIAKCSGGGEKKLQFKNSKINCDVWYIR
jgi:hypothetical protein